MRVLHVVKTADGAAWAAKLVRVLCSLGTEVHVVLPRLEGRCMDLWRCSGATLHEVNLDLPIAHPWKLPEVLSSVQRLVGAIEPDLIHSHFLGNTLALRWALGKRHHIPRLYQVAGPLHLEHSLYRNLELYSAGPVDRWIGSSRCILGHYLRAGIDPKRLFLSYYGDDLYTPRNGDTVTVRDLACARREDVVIGNISWMYPPKRYLGQHIGLKAHEDIIEAMGLVLRKNPRALGVFGGGAWGGATWYEHALKRKAHAIAGDRIRFIGELPYSVAHDAWRGYDLAVHVPISENCGGVIEPLLAGVPVIASDTGGLPEVIQHGKSGWLVPAHNPRALADAISHAIANRLEAQELAVRGRELVRTMFDANRTGRETFDIYRHVLGERDKPPVMFDSQRFVQAVISRRTNVAPVTRKELLEIE